MEQKDVSLAQSVESSREMIRLLCDATGLEIDESDLPEVVVRFRLTMLGASRLEEVDTRGVEPPLKWLHGGRA